MWNEIIDILKQIFVPTPPVQVKPTVRKEVSFAYVFGVLNGLFPKAEHIYLSDNKYWLCSEADIRKFLKLDATNKEKYLGEIFDCDDFSYRLMGQLSTPEWSGIAAGVIWTELHAACCFIDNTGKLWLIEPQTDELYDTIPPWMGHEILFILM